MLPSNRTTLPQHKHLVTSRKKNLILFQIVGLFLFLALLLIELAPLGAQIANAQTQNHTVASVEPTCSTAYYSGDGNPFALCPGPYPGGGNCVWWAWEQWHLLGYDLPLNWGNAADWIVDAERAGFPVGTIPRIGSIAVFPRADGVWAFGPEGHVAFVTNVSSDGNTFNVTYQNYGDPHPMYVGIGYNVSVINQSNFQNGELRFIYFPRDLDPQLLSRLPGIGNVDLSAIMQANAQAATSSGFGDMSSASTTTSSRLALGLSSTSTDEEFNADFAGTGLSDLLLYNRQQGSLDILSMYSPPLPPQARHYLTFDEMQPNADPSLNVVSLGDSITPVGGWGPSLDVHVGNFSGGNASEILLYDRVTG
ncbi:MAG TPA: CHAP domain-containing protein, partial [Ktedonobacteraceae bacterium]